MNKCLVATRLDSQTHNALTLLARKRDRTIAYLLRKATEGFLQAEMRKERRTTQ